MSLAMWKWFRYKQNKYSTSPEISWRNDLRRSPTIVDIVTKDRGSLFEKIAGAFSVSELNILVQEQSREKMDWLLMYFMWKTKKEVS